MLLAAWQRSVTGSAANRRELKVAVLQQQLRSKRALITDSEIARLKQETLPSGKTVEQFYAEQVANMKQYWLSQGQL